MAKKISLMDARREGLRRNTDFRAIEKPEKPKPVEPPPAVAVQDNTAVQGVATAIERVASVVAAQSSTTVAAMQAVVAQIANRPPPPTGWKFTVTQRDRFGNIVSFTAQANNEEDHETQH